MIAVWRRFVCLIVGHDWRYSRPVNAKNGTDLWTCARCPKRVRG